MASANLQKYVGEKYQEKFQLLYSETAPNKWHGSNFKGEKTHGKVAHKSLCSLPSALMSQAAGVAMASVILPVLLNEYICLCLGFFFFPPLGLVRTLNGSSLR